VASYDLRIDIPVRAFINASLLLLVEQGGTLFDAKKEFFSREGIREMRLDPYNHTVDDPSLAISLLYCTIVVPRELLDLPCNHTIYRDLDAKTVTTHFDVARPTPIDSFTLIRSLRHSVAHALFSIRQEKGVVEYDFWTEREPIFQARTTAFELRTFINTVGICLTNALLPRKFGPPDQ